jgi:hypothetical protein
MADSTLSGLTSFGTTPDLTYGEEGLVSKKYSGYKIYNVKDFGAKGDNTNDDTPPIQLALNAALATGGIVWFPPGIYKLITSPKLIGSTGFAALQVPGGNTAGIRLVGCGLKSNLINFSKSYILDIDYGAPGTTAGPIMSIEGLNFGVRFNFATSGSAWSDLVDTESCAGGIHISVGIGQPNIYNCFFELWNGIGVFSASQNTIILGSPLQGNYDGTHAPRSIGYFLNSGSVRDSKVTAAGYGIIGCGSGGSTVVVDELDMEKCGTPISHGYSPIGFLEPIVA